MRANLMAFECRLIEIIRMLSRTAGRKLAYAGDEQNITACTQIAAAYSKALEQSVYK